MKIFNNLVRAVTVKLEKFSELEKKIGTIIAKHTAVKQEREKFEARFADKNKEGQEVKKQLEKLLKERDALKRKLDGILEKFESLDSF